MTAILHAFAAAPDWLFACGVTLFTFGLVVLIWAGIGRHGNVHIGPDPVIPKPLSDATTVIFPTLDAAPNYRRTDEYRSDLADWFPLADTVDLSPQLAAVAAYLRRTETRVTEVVITIPRPRHRYEDLHSDTRPLDASLRRAIAARAEQ